jgi:serine/threonine protein kinase
MLTSPRRQLEAVIRDSEGRQLARCLIRRGRYIIGQEKRNEIVVDEPSISSRHARLTMVGEDEFYVEDLESANGTFIGGQPAKGLARIPAGTRVAIGGCFLDLQRGGLPAAVFQYLPEGFLRENRYNLGEPIIEGRTSTIFSAYDTTLGRDIAIKVLKPESQANFEHVLRFIREAQITSQLQHPGILTVYELGLNEQTQLYYTTRFIEGDSLGNVLDAMEAHDPAALRAHSLASLLTGFQKACDAVAYANARGIVHAGLRPDTITLGGFGEVAVISWCFARVLERDPSGLPLPRVVLAAPVDATPPLTPYTAPEVAAGDMDAVSARTDVYGLGAILYRMITLHRPIAFEDPDALLQAITHGDIRQPSLFAKEPHPHCPGARFPGPLVAIVLKALSLNPENRYASVPEFQAAVAAWQQGLLR